MRHSAAHVLAAAVQRLYPNAKFGVGPVIDNGFYYDILTEEPLSEKDLKGIQREMIKIIKEGYEMEREEMPMDDAIDLFSEMKQNFKIELLETIKEKGTTKIHADDAQDIDPDSEVVSVYKTGDFVDLCRGPHVENVKEIGAFKLWKLAGAYWRGNENNPQMQRVYGLCFETKDELKAYERMIEEAKKRDHRKLGQELELYTIVDEIGGGLPLFYPRGTILRSQIESLVDRLQTQSGYETIWVPHITKGKLYEISGHLDKYDAMYPPMKLEGEDDYYLKPMNCPHFMMLFKSLPHSYRDMPVRWVSTTSVYRYEKSGELSGLTRVRSITQDDCHVFTTPDQIEGEINLMLDMIKDIYKAFGFDDFWVSISTHDPQDAEKYIGDEKVWKDSESALETLIKNRDWKYQVVPGEAAFYGPKLDFMFRDAIGREWQLSTIQLDMNLPERFDLNYIDQNNEKQRPVVIHRAMLGSVERFMGILIEHYAGAFPLWLAPEQVRLVPVSDDYVSFAEELAVNLAKENIRVSVDSSKEGVGKKIRNSAKMKTPWTIVLGEKEVNGGDYTVNIFGQEEDLVIPANDLLEVVKRESKVPQDYEA